jgi:ribose transport system substrate-binding protein
MKLARGGVAYADSINLKREKTKPKEQESMSAMNRRRFSLLAASALAAPLIVRHSGDSLAQDATPAAAAAGAESLEAMEGQVYSTGPNGEEPTAASEVTLSDEELAEIQAMGATAAIVMHYGGNDWSVAQIAGLKDQFGKMGIEVIAETDAGFDPATQVSDIETTLARNPSIIVSIPTDPVATAAAYRQAAEQGVQLVFMDNVPQGFTPGTDYVSVVSADNYGNGVASAHIMAEELGGAGKIGLVYHAADFFVTRQRYDAFKATIAEHYPDIEIVEEQGIAGPDFAGDGDRVAAAMLTKHQDLNGIWAVWDVPAEGVVTAIRTAGRENDVIVTTIDLGQNVAVSIAQDGIVKGLGAQRPFDQGVTEAMLAGYGLLGKEAPAYVALPALPVTHENVLEAWQEVYHQDPPPALTEAAGQ